MGPALSMTLTLHTDLLPFILSSVAYRFLFSLENGMYGQKSIDSYFGGI